MAGESPTRFWDEFAHHWVVEPPQAPVDEDLAWFQEQLDRTGPEPGPILVLGVTPEFLRMPLPPGAWLLATDFSGGMIREVWLPGAEGGASLVAQGDWRFLPWKSASARVVMGDGCFGVLPGPAAMQRVCREVSRVLQPGGRFLLRCFVRDPEPVPVDALFEELQAGQVRQIGWFRWRIAMALQGAGERGVDRHRVWEEWTARLPDWEHRVGRWGLPPEFVHRIRRWEGERTPLHFPTLEEVLDLARPHFDVLGIDIPGYASGPCFPRVVFGRAAQRDREVR
jgi:SAM-dependent methyltransferase